MADAANTGTVEKIKNNEDLTNGEQPEPQRVLWRERNNKMTLLTRLCTSEQAWSNQPLYNYSSEFIPNRQLLQIPSRPSSARESLD